MTDTQLAAELDEFPQPTGETPESPESPESPGKPDRGFTLSLSGGVAPISAIACLDEARIVVITDGVARWLSPDGAPGPRVGGRPRCRGRAVSICVWGRAIGILYADPPGLDIVTSADEHLFSFDGILMPVAGGIGLAMNADTIAIAGEDPKIYLLDRRTLAIRDILRVRGVERLAAARDGAFWATIPRTGRLVRLGPAGAVTDALSGFSRPGVPAFSNAVAAVPDADLGAVVLKAIDPTIPSSSISGEPLRSPTGVIVLPDGALLVSQETEPYLLRYEPPR